MKNTGTAVSAFVRLFSSFAPRAAVKDVFSLIACTALMLSFIVPSAHAATGTWNADASATWSAGNWTPAVADGAGFTANLTFNITATRTITLDTARTIGTLNIGDLTTTSSSFTLALGANNLTFDNSASAAVLAQNSTSNGDTISGASGGKLVIAGNGTLNVTNAASGKTLTISSGIISGLTTGTQTLNMNNANAVTVSGVIGDGATGGKIALTQTGAGTTTLSTNNIFTGAISVSAGALTLSGTNTASGVTLTAGTLNINNAGALGAGTLTISGGTINNSSAADITTPTNNNVQAWNGSFTFGGTKALNLGTGGVTIGGASSPTVTVAGSGLNGAGALTVGGNISGTGKSLTKAGAGTLILSGTNSYNSGTTITGGVLQFNSAAAIAGSGNNVTVNPVGSTSGATAAFGYVLDQATLTDRIVVGSQGTVALAADSANNLDFTAAGLTKLSLGASTGTWTYSGSLWTPADSIYRLGGGGGTLTFNPTLTSGSLLVGGGGSGGTVTLVNAGTYSGGTTVTGGIGGTTVGATGGPSLLQTNVLTGASNTPFGSNAAITLNNGALGLGTAGTLASGNVMNVTGYDVTYSGQNTIKLAVGSGSSVTLAANTLSRSNNGVLLVAPSAGANLGSTEKVTVASGAPTVTNGMVAPYYIDGTTKTFLTYDPVNGFKDVTFTKSGNASIIASAGATDIVSVTDSTFTSSFGGTKAIYALKYLNSNVFNANGLGSGVETLTILSGGLIFDLPNANGGVNISSDGSQHGSINFGTSEAMVGVFTGSVVQGNQNNTNWIGSGGFTLYGSGFFSANSMLTTGGINIVGGTFKFGGSGVINSNNYMTVAKAGTLQFTSAATNQVLGLSGEGLINNTSSNATFIIDGLTGTGTTTFSGLIQNGSGTIALTKNGLNTQVLSGANSYTGTTTVSGGVLRLDFSGANAPASNIINNTANSSALTLAGGKLDIVGAAGVTNSQQFNNLTVNAGNSSISVSSGTGGTTNVTLGGGTPTLTRNAGGTINFDLPTSGTVSTTATTFSGNGVLVSTSATGPAFATVNGTDWAKVTTGTIGALASYDTNDFSASTKNTDVTSNQGPAAFTVNTLRFNTAGTTLTLTGTNIIGTGGILVTSATSGAGNGVTITGGTNIKSSAGNEMVIINNGQLTVGSVIADGSAASALTLSGSGTTTLSGSNSFTGPTYLNSGTAIAGNANAFGSSTPALNLNGGTLASSATLTIASKPVVLLNNSTIGGSNDLTLGGTFTNSGRNNILTVNNAGNTTLSGASVYLSEAASGTTRTLTIAGSGNLTISGTVKTSSGTATSSNLVYAGTGTLTLSNAANTYAGVTKVSSGTLSVGTLAAGGANSSIGTSSNAATSLVVDGGTFKYTGATVSTDRLFSVGGSGGTIDASGSGALTFSNTGSLGFNNTPGTRTLTLGGSNTGANTLTPIVSDFLGLYATSLTKTGSGQWVLAGLNTYTGGTAVNAGTLVVANTFTMSGANSINAAATGIAGTDYATVTNTVGTLTFGGTLGINLTASLVGGETFTLFSASGGALAGNFSSVSVTGSYLAPLTNNSGTWTGSGDGYSFTFETSGLNAGILTVAAIPEPATCAAIFGALALAGVVYRRRRRS